MASNAELVNLSEEDKRKLMEARQQKKWSVNILGMDVPLWLVVLVIIVILYLLHTYGYLTTVENKMVEFSEGTRNVIDRVTRRKATSSTSPLLSPASPIGASAKINGPAAEAVKTQLRHMFGSF
jgi:hypothetical protein